MTARSLTSTCALTVVSAVAALALAGCGVLGGPDDAKRDESSGEITEAAEAAVTTLKVGDCLDLSDQSQTQTEVDSLPTVPCTDPHDSEVYAETTVAGDELPTDVTDQADSFCLSEFEGFVGMAYDSSSLEVNYLYPTSASWDQGDRSIQCIVMSASPVTGTLQGANV